MKHIHTLVALALLAAAAPASAQSFGIGISGTVPATCNVKVVGDKISNCCNVPHGFTLTADYDKALAGSVVTIGEEKIILNDTGKTELIKTAAPTIGESRFDLKVADNAKDKTLRFRITPNQ